MIRHTFDWNKDTSLEFIGPIRPKTGEPRKLICDGCGAEFAAPLQLK